MAADYFDVYFPKSDVTTSDRFFFFNSLRGSELGDRVLSVLNSHRDQVNFKDKDAEGFQIIENAMNFLKQMIEAEQANEKEYFTINIINNNKLPEQIRQDCQKAISDTNINYKNFINLINEYYDGAQAYRKNLEFEIRRLAELEKLYKKFDKYYIPNEKGEYIIQRKGENVSTNYYGAFTDFLCKGFKNGWISKDEQNFGFNTQTLANLIQGNLKSIFNQIWKSIDFREKLRPFILNGFSGCEKELTTELLNNFLHGATPVIIDLLNQQNNDLCYKLKRSDVKTIIDKFLDSMDKIPGNSSKEKIENSTLINLIDGYKGLISEQEHIKYNNDRIIRAYKDNPKVSKNRKNGIDNLGPEMIDLLQSILQSRTQGKLAEKAVWDRSDIYKALTEMFPEEGLQIKGAKYDFDKMINIINKELENKQLIGVNIAAKDNINSEKFNQSGLQEAIISEGRLGEVILTFGTQKADVSGIEIAEITITPSTINWSTIAQNITKGFIKTLDIQDAEIISSNLSFDEKAFRKKNRFSAKEFSIEAETMRRLALKEQEIEKLKKDLEDAQLETKEIEQILDSLKNNVQIGSTVKSYNKYDSRKGFHGGSLSGTVENQLRNIYELFKYGGVSTLPDKDWLTFAIYNAGPELLGSDLKDPIEDFLTTAAVMLMFDDVGQQAVYLNQQIRQKYNLDSHNGSKFLHLYNLNGFYYPASFILQLTYNKLTEIFTILELDKLSGTQDFDNFSNGSRAEIVNPVNRALQVGEVYKQGKKEILVTQQEQWAQTFQANYKSVSVNVTFLAGMLDIIKILNANL